MYDNNHMIHLEIGTVGHDITTDMSRTQAADLVIGSMLVSRLIIHIVGDGVYSSLEQGDLAGKLSR